MSANNVRMRSGASMSSGILHELFYGNKVTIVGTEGEWTAVYYNGEYGYIYSSYVKQGSLNYSDIINSGDSSELGRQIADYAPSSSATITAGATSPSSGFDCSGLVSTMCTASSATSLNRVACDQANNGVSVTGLQPGDILCFYSGGSYIGHVGIYIGDNKFVHAQNSATGVVVTELAGYMRAAAMKPAACVTQLNNLPNGALFRAALFVGFQAPKDLRISPKVFFVN